MPGAITATGRLHAGLRYIKGSFSLCPRYGNAGRSVANSAFAWKGGCAMRAVVCESFGGPEVLALREVPDPPPPGAGEVQVRIRARGVQYVDALQMAGKYQTRRRAALHPRQRGGRRGAGGGTRRDGVRTRRPRDEPARHRRLRRDRQRAGRRLRQGAGRHGFRAGRRLPLGARHRLSRAVAARADGGGQLGAGAWRGRRHRHRRHPDRAALRRQGDRHRQHRSQARGLPGGRRASTPSTTATASPIP